MARPGSYSRVTHLELGFGHCHDGDAFRSAVIGDSLAHLAVLSSYKWLEQIGKQLRAAPRAKGPKTPTRQRQKPISCGLCLLVYAAAQRRRENML